MYNERLTCSVLLLALLLSCELRLASLATTGQSRESNRDLDFTLVSQEVSRHNYNCLPWTYYDEVDNSCKCYQYAEIPLCEQTGDSLAILKGYCITYDEKKQVASAGQCVYLFPGLGYVYTVHIDNYTDLNSVVCGDFNRKGVLCSECVMGKNIPSYSYRVSCIDSCTPSTVNWIRYFLITLLPTTVFYVFIVIFKINVHSSIFQGFIFLIQFSTSPFAGRLAEGYFRLVGHNLAYIVTYVYGSFGAIWNLDFLRGIDSSICLGLSPLGQLSLDYVTVLYTLLLIAGTYILIGWHDKQVKIVVIIWKPIYKFCQLFRKNWNIHSSVIDSLATFLILCNIKVLNVCVDILKPVKVYQLTQEGGCRWSVFNDPKLQYFGKDHLPYAMFAIFMFVIFVAIPILLLLLYPTRLFQKTIARLPSRWKIFLKILVDSFQGIYKDRTEPNTKDFRWFSAIPFVTRLVLMSLSYDLDITFSVNCVMLLLLTGILTIITDPCKDKVKYISTHFTVFVLVTAAAFVALYVTGNTTSNTMYMGYFGATMMTLPYLYLMFFLMSWIKVRGYHILIWIKILKRKV